MLCFFNITYHNDVDTTRINPPVNVVTSEVFTPFMRILGAIMLISGTALKAEFKPMYVANMPNETLNTPRPIKLWVKKGSFKFLIATKPMIIAKIINMIMKGPPLMSKLNI